MLVVAAAGTLTGCPVQQRRKDEFNRFCTDPKRPVAYYLKGNVWKHCVRLDGHGSDMYCCRGRR